MKLEVYAKSVQTIHLELYQNPYNPGELTVHCVDEDGNHIENGNLITFFPDGTFRRNYNVNSSLGFQLEDGRIK